MEQVIDILNKKIKTTKYSMRLCSCQENKNIHKAVIRALTDLKKDIIANQQTESNDFEGINKPMKWQKKQQ
jgi:hypothetical protein